MASPIDPSATHYLDQLELFQRQLATAAFKIAGGVDLSSSSAMKPLKQNTISQAFVVKIVKAFLDALYAFLDGLVLLASNESPIVTGKRPVMDVVPSLGLNALALLDLMDTVGPVIFTSSSILMVHRIQEYCWSFRILATFRRQLCRACSISWRAH